MSDSHSHNTRGSDLDLAPEHCDLSVISAYKDLQSRENTRNAAWQQEGWDKAVYYTGESPSERAIMRFGN